MGDVNDLKRLLCVLLGALMVAMSACAQRGGVSSVSSAAPEPVSSAAPEPEPSSSVAAVSSAPESSKPEEPEEYPLPVLTEGELALLAEELQVYLEQIGGVNLKDASAIDPAEALPAIFAEIDRLRSMNGYFFSKNSAGQEMIAEELVQEIATRMFGIDVFPQIEGYDLDTRCYTYLPGKKSQQVFDVAEPVGAPDGAIAYQATDRESGNQYLFTCQIVRVNSIPYLRLLSVARVIQ